jgi:hypothetical protein
MQNVRKRKNTNKVGKREKKIVVVRTPKNLVARMCTIML